MKTPILKITGEQTGREIELNDLVFGIEPNEHVVYLDVKQHLANKRQGNSQSKERGFVAGSTKKVKKQKGTGTARCGSVKSPVFRGGGRAFGPNTRSYDFKLNKKTKRLARISVLSDKVRNNSLLVVEDFDFEKIKTKNYIEFEKNLKINDKKSLLVLASKKNNVYLSARNLKNATVTTASELTTYDIINASSVVLFESSVEMIESYLKKI